MSGDNGTDAVAPEGSIEFGPPSSPTPGPAAVDRRYPGFDCPHCAGRIEITDLLVLDPRCEHCGRPFEPSAIPELCIFNTKLRPLGDLYPWPWIEPRPVDRRYPW